MSFHSRPRPSNARQRWRAFGGLVVLGLFGACSSPLERPPLTTDCTQGDDYVFEAISPSFWFGFGDETPGAYDGSEDGLTPSTEIKSGCMTQTVDVPLSTPPDPKGLATRFAQNEDAPERCGNKTPTLLFKTNGHKDWGSAVASALATRSFPYQPTGEPASHYEGLALWAKSAPDADKVVTFIVETAQTAKPDDGTPKYRADPDSKDPVCPDRWRDKYGDPILQLDENNKPLLDDDGHAIRDYPGDCKEAAAEDGAVVYRQDTSGNIIISSGAADPDDCGNPFRVLLETTDRWKLYLFPWNSFWQEAEPNRDPDGIDEAKIYQFAFRAEKEKSIELWIDGLSFYRHVDFVPPDGSGGSGGSTSTTTSSSTTGEGGVPEVE